MNRPTWSGGTTAQLTEICKLVYYSSLKGVSGKAGRGTGTRGGWRGVVDGLTEPKIFDVKGSVFEEAFGAARCEQLGLGCGKTWRIWRDLWSCWSAVTWGQRGPRHSDGDGCRGQRFCHDGNCRWTADLLSDTPGLGKCACSPGKSKEGKKSRQSVGSTVRMDTFGNRRLFHLTCLVGGGRVSVGALRVWVGGGVSCRPGLAMEDDVELQRERFEYPVRGWYTAKKRGESNRWRQNLFIYYVSFTVYNCPWTVQGWDDPCTVSPQIVRELI